MPNSISVNESLSGVMDARRVAGVLHLAGDEACTFVGQASGHVGGRAAVGQERRVDNLPVPASRGRDRRVGAARAGPGLGDLELEARARRDRAALVRDLEAQAAGRSLGDGGERGVLRGRPRGGGLRTVVVSPAVVGLGQVGRRVGAERGVVVDVVRRRRIHLRADLESVRLEGLDPVGGHRLRIPSPGLGEIGRDTGGRGLVDDRLVDLALYEGVLGPKAHARDGPRGASVARVGPDVDAARDVVPRDPVVEVGRRAVDHRVRADLEAVRQEVLYGVGPGRGKRLDGLARPGRHAGETVHPPGTVVGHHQDVLGLEAEAVDVAVVQRIALVGTHRHLAGSCPEGDPVVGHPALVRFRRAAHRETRRVERCDRVGQRGRRLDVAGRAAAHRRRAGDRVGGAGRLDDHQVGLEARLCDRSPGRAVAHVGAGPNEHGRRDGHGRLRVRGVGVERAAVRVVVQPEAVVRPRHGRRGGPQVELSSVNALAASVIPTVL